MAESFFTKQKGSFLDESDEVDLKFFDSHTDVDKKGNDGNDAGTSNTRDTEDSIGKFQYPNSKHNLDKLDDDYDGPPAKKIKTKKELEIEERERMQVLVSHFTEDQLDRYEMYRRSAFPKAAVKRLMQTITGCSVSQNVVIAMSGIAKVFVGEIVEEALDVMENAGEMGALQPKYLREAVRRLRQRDSMPIGRFQRPLFRLN